MPLLTLMSLEMLKMEFMTWMVKITGGLNFSITLEVVVTVLMVLENLVVSTTVVVVALIQVTIRVHTSILISLLLQLKQVLSYLVLHHLGHILGL